MTEQRGDGPEIRSVSEFEARQSADGTWKIGGYASTFNDPYQVHDRFGTFSETILPGAWDRTLGERGHKIQLLASHDGLPYASTRSKSLRLSTDKHGLEWEARLSADSPRAQDLGVGIRDGYIDEMSVGMRVPASGDSWNGDMTERNISEASLLEISVVARGANPNTEASMREAELLAELRSLRAAMNEDADEQIELDAVAMMSTAADGIDQSLVMMRTALEQMQLADANPSLARSEELTDVDSLRHALNERMFRIPVTQELAQLLQRK